MRRTGSPSIEKRLEALESHEEAIRRLFDRLGSAQTHVDRRHSIERVPLREQLLELLRGAKEGSIRLPAKSGLYRLEGHVQEDRDAQARDRAAVAFLREAAASRRDDRRRKRRGALEIGG